MCKGDAQYILGLSCTGGGIRRLEVGHGIIVIAAARIRDRRRAAFVADIGVVHDGNVLFTFATTFAAFRSAWYW
jgi:hypothetical protein